MDDRDTGPTEDTGQRGGVDRKRVDQRHLVGPGDLNQSQVGHVGALGVEFGVEAVGVLGCHLGDQGFESLGIGDHCGRCSHRGAPGGGPGSAALVFSAGADDFMVPARRVSVMPGPDGPADAATTGPGRATRLQVEISAAGRCPEPDLASFSWSERVQAGW